MATTFSKTGTKSSSNTTLPKSVFSVDIKSHDLIKQAYLTNLANQRSNNAKTLVRSETRGGGKKPWRQKGTGRARAGSIRSPLWAGGAITFGPTGEENYTKKMTKKSKNLALKQALTLASKEGKISVIEDFDIKDGKTKEANKVIAKVTDAHPVALVLTDPSVETLRAVRNIANVNLINAKYISVNAVLDARHIIVSKSALKDIEAVVGGKNE